MEADTSTAKSLVGTTLDNRYQITAVLGQGGMSTVYKARHLFLHRDVAVKIMQDHLSSNVEGRMRFQREAQMAAALNHPNIVGVTEFGVSEQGEPYMVMDYLRGESLSEFIKKRGRLPDPAMALTIFRQIGAALQHAHEKGVLHRDLKPSNVMLVRNPIDNSLQCKVVDLGLARALPSASNREDRRLTAAGELVGSPFYMSPEQIRDEELDVRSDIYSFGCLLYEVLTGVRPFIDTNAISVLSMHLYEAPPPFGLVLQPNRIPPRLESIVMKCMEKSRSSRYQTMKDLFAPLQAMEPWEDGLSKSIPYDPVEALSQSVAKRPLGLTGSIELDGIATGGFEKPGNFTLKLQRPPMIRNRMLAWLHIAYAPLWRKIKPHVKRVRDSFEGKGVEGRRQRIAGTRVLVAVLGESREMIANADDDAKKYAVYYKNVDRRRAMNAQEFLVLLSTEQFDIIHLHGTFNRQAVFKDSTGFQLRISDVKRACDYAKVKLLWLASDNKLEWLKDNPILENRSYHFILNSERGSNFPKFLSTFLSRIARGEPVISAWDSVLMHVQYKGDKVHCRLVPGAADVAFLP